MSAIFVFLMAALNACHTGKPAGAGQPMAGNKPGAKPPKYETIDTIRWSSSSNPRPPIKNDAGKPGSQPGVKPAGAGQTYRVAYLLPFLADQSEENKVPEKSRLALQFYAGANLALKQIAEEGAINLIVDVFDTPLNDADFQTMLNDYRLSKAQILIGPVRASHVQMAAEWAKKNHKILISPESPNADLTSKNPDFIQINPSLRAHCEAIASFIQEKYRLEGATLLCKQKESDRLPYFQQYLKNKGSQPFRELVVPDETVNFDKIDLKPYLKSTQTSVFVVPSWSSQDFIMAFLRKIKTTAGAGKVVVIGMPQWKSFESIEPDYYKSLNVHVSSGEYVNFGLPDVKIFQQGFYDATGTIPDYDGFNGYDITLWLGKMLKNYGLSFPDRLSGQPFQGLRSSFLFRDVFSSGKPADAAGMSDYRENGFVYILRFDGSGFVPATD